MKKLSLCCGFVFLCLVLHAQYITGKVYRYGTDTVIIGASVYYNGSETGTITNNYGEFAIPAKSLQIPLIVSSVGYYSATIHYTPGKPLIVYLKPKIVQLPAVNINADAMDRKQEIALFIREFVGVSSYALSCTIKNLEDINFFYDERQEKLTATCSKPLIIENKKLGYIINYYLDKFERTPGEVNFAGNCIFKEMVPEIALDSNKIKRNREDVYNGSRMQFIRALWRKNITKTGFRMIRSRYNWLTEDSIIINKSLTEKYLNLKGDVYISYYTDRRQGTTLTQRETLSFIDSDGFYGTGIHWAGAMGRQRIGDALPFEYRSEKEVLSTLKVPSLAILSPGVIDSIAPKLQTNGRKKDVTQLKEVTIKGTKKVTLRNGSLLTTYVPDQNFDITPKDYQYKTLEWFLLQNTKGAQKSNIQDTSGVVYPGIDTARYKNGYRAKTKLMPPAILVNGKELYMEEPHQAEIYRNIYFNMPIQKIKKVVLKHMVGTLHGMPSIDINNSVSRALSLDATAERIMVDRYLLFIVLDE